MDRNAVEVAVRVDVGLLVVVLFVLG